MIGLEQVLTVRNLSKAYGDHLAVNKLNLSVNRGETVGLLGPNGAGKSTSIECILGVKTRDAGEVALLGMDPVRNRKRVFERVGVQFQENYHHPKIKVKELCDVTQALYRAPSDWVALAERFGLAKKQDCAVGELSGGEKQRLNVLLALIPNPEAVFLDELTSGLDTKARRDIWAYLKALKANGLTVVLTSHYMDEVEALCDRLIILNQGVTVAEGSISEVIRASGQTTLENAYLFYAKEDAADESF